jgi:hypothetical protein
MIAVRTALFAAIFVVAAASSVAGATVGVSPRLLLSTHSAAPGDTVVVRVERVRVRRQQLMRLYLVRRAAAASVRSRLDANLQFIGSVPVTRTSRGHLRFTVPPLAAGSYVLAYWCADCVSHRGGIGVARSAILRIEVPTGNELCPVTKPNRSVPLGVMPSANWHGNGALWASLPLNGTYALASGEDTLFEKRIWLASAGLTSRLTVQYRTLEPPSPARTAVTIAGTLSGYKGPSWVSREYLTAGCWKVTGRIADISLSFVVNVLRP